jgi:hypothetical protein
VSWGLASDLKGSGGLKAQKFITVSEKSKPTSVVINKYYM